MSRRKPREPYPDSTNLRQRLWQLIREEAGSVEMFAQRAGISLAALRSYLDGSRSPSAQILYKLWKTLGVSPSFLIAGVGPQLLGPPAAQISSWSPDVCGGAQPRIYASNSTIDYSIDPRKGILSIKWQFHAPRRPRERELLWPGDAGLSATFPPDQFPSGRDWSDHDGLRLCLRTNCANGVRLGLKIKTGTSPPRQIELGVALPVHMSESQHILRFKTLRDLDSRFDPQHVRALTFAASRSLSGATRVTAHLSCLEFLR